MSQTYKPHEIKAGRTLFIVTRQLDQVSPTRLKATYAVAQYLVASKREPQPEPGTAHPYRMHPEVARYAADVTDAWKTRRAAQREADRRQALEDAS